MIIHDSEAVIFAVISVVLYAAAVMLLILALCAAASRGDDMADEAFRDSEASDA